MVKKFFSLLAALGLVSTVAWADPIKLGGSAVNVQCTTNSTIISATTNAAGLTITNGTLNNSGGGTFFQAVYPDGTTRTLWWIDVEGTSPSGITTTSIPYPITIPAGIALTCTASPSGTGNVMFSYDLYAH